MSNVDTVRQIYAAFRRGDVTTILGRLSESVEWEYGIVSTDVPWLQPRRGRAAVGGFFEAIGTGLDIHRFEPKTFLEHANIVVVLADFDATVKATGHRIVEEDEPHIWYFDERGQVNRFRHRADTHQQWAAFKGESVPAV